MTNDLVKPEKQHWDEKQMSIIRSTICKNCSDDEIVLFSYICQRTGLDPFARQIYAVKRGNAMTIQTGIDGFRLIAERTNKYAPGKEPSYEYDKHGKILKATAYVKKLTPDGTWHDVSASAYWAEYAQEYNGKPSTFWGKLPHLMIGKCAESLALRKAFPADLSGIYTEDEMDQANNKPIDVKPIDNVAQPDVAQPEVAQPEVAQPEVAQPEKSETVTQSKSEDDEKIFKEHCKKVEELLKLIEQCPEKRRTNFYAIINKKGWTHPSDMSPKFLEIQLSTAKELLRSKDEEVPF